MLEYSRNCGSFGFRQLHEYSIGKNYMKCLTVTYTENEIVLKSSNSNSNSLCSLRTIAPGKGKNPLLIPLEAMR